jgi:hypothetical protein
MNTDLTNTRLPSRTIALTACLIALCAGAIACGAKDGTATAPAAISKQGTSEGFIKSSRADQAEYLRQLHAKRVAQIRPKTFGDDRRQQNGPHLFGDDRRQQNG